MAEHRASVVWVRRGEAFVDGQYSRTHRWLFDEGLEVAASASPLIVPHPLSHAAAVDPEEGFVASLASCHMLWFLSLAAKEGWLIDQYEDDASGVLERDSQGHRWMSRVTLRPCVVWGSEKVPSREALMALHHRAHEACFLARSVRSEVVIEPVM